MYLLNVCTSIHAVRFTNLSVLTINALKVSNCFTFLFAAVPMCFHAAMFHMAVSFTCFFFVTFLNFLSRVHLMYLQGRGACETSNYRNPVRRFAKPIYQTNKMKNTVNGKMLIECNLGRNK